MKKKPSCSVFPCSSSIHCHHLPPLSGVLGTPQVRTKFPASPQPSPNTRPHLHSQAERRKQRDIWAGVTPTPALTGPHRRAMDTGQPGVGWDGGSILLRLLLSLLRSCRSSCSCCPTGNSGIGASIESCGQGQPPRKGQGVED